MFADKRRLQRSRSGFRFHTAHTVSGVLDAWRGTKVEPAVHLLHDLFDLDREPTAAADMMGPPAGVMLWTRSRSPAFCSKS
jgi:hypothetical protein